MNKNKANGSYTFVTKDKKKESIYKTLMLVIIVAFVTFLLTSLGIYNYFIKTEKGENSETIFNSHGSLDSKLAVYKKLIDQYYMGEVDEKKLEEGAIKGYIDGLGDKYTEFISKDDMQDYKDNLMGNFTGVGIYMVKNEEKNKIQVLAPIKNSPAEEAGIQPGDIIQSVNGEEFEADDMTVAANKIKGEEGTSVKLVILRGNETLDFELKRKKIELNPVESEVLQNNIGYISFNSFDENTSSEFRKQFEELQKKGIKSLIIDLRNNGGGIVDEATKIADYVLDKNSTILYEVNKQGKEKETKSEHTPIINMPIVILVNENTASSSEILAGALQDLNKATIIGKKTYGKGVIQQVLSLADGSGLKITTEEYQTPNRKKITESGIKPDKEVELPENVNIVNLKKEQDTQLQAAIEELK